MLLPTLCALSSRCSSKERGAAVPASARWLNKWVILPDTRYQVTLLLLLFHLFTNVPQNVGCFFQSSYIPSTYFTHVRTKRTQSNEYYSIYYWYSTSTTTLGTSTAHRCTVNPQILFGSICFHVHLRFWPVNRRSNPHTYFLKSVQSPSERYPAQKNPLS